MRCKIDENLPAEAADLLRAGGHECHTVFDERLGGEVDARVHEQCRREGRVLLTSAPIRRTSPRESSFFGWLSQTATESSAWSARCSWHLTATP